MAIDTAIRALINSYIIDNQAQNITPAKQRDMMQQTIDFILTAATGGGGGVTDFQDALNGGSNAIDGGGNTGQFTLTDLTSGSVAIYSALKTLFTDPAGNTFQYGQSRMRYTAVSGKLYDLSSFGLTFSDGGNNNSSAKETGFSVSNLAAGITSSASVKYNFIQFFKGDGAGSNIFTKIYGPLTAPSIPSPVDSFYLPYKGGTTDTFAMLSDLAAYMSSALASGKIFVGNGGGVAAAVSLSGDATLSNTGAMTLANSGVTAGTYGGSSLVPSIVVDAKGRITAISNTAIGAGYKSVYYITADANQSVPITGDTLVILAANITTNRTLTISGGVQGTTIRVISMDRAIMGGTAGTWWGLLTAGGVSFLDVDGMTYPGGGGGTPIISGISYEFIYANNNPWGAGGRWYQVSKEGLSKGITVQDKFLSTGTTAVVGAAAGSGGSVGLGYATQVSGIISIVTGTSPTANAILATITWDLPLQSTFMGYPVIALFPANQNAAALSGATQVYVDTASSDRTKFVLKSGSTPLAASTSYIFNYFLTQYI